MKMQPLTATLLSAAFLLSVQGCFKKHRDAVLRANHPVVGSWFGKAVQILPSGSPPDPGLALHMSPTLTADGQFLGNDTLALAGPPFGPHTTAHGRWEPVNRTEIVADYLFMLPSPVPQTTIAARFRWQAEAIDEETMVGYVNIWIGPPIPEEWEALGPDDFPTVSAEGTDLVKVPAEFYRDPDDCPGPVCPLVFKFTIHKVQSE